MMMRFASIVALTLLLGGCAAQSAKPATRPTVSVEPREMGPASLALVVDPPVILGQPPIELARAGRQAAAFGSYQNLTTTYFSIQTIDQQASDWSDNYQRRTEMNQVGLSYR